MLVDPVVYFYYGRQQRHSPIRGRQVLHPPCQDAHSPSDAAGDKQALDLREKYPKS